MSKYETLKQFLDGLERKPTWLTFDDVEAQLGFKLPESARRHRGWWANEAATHVQARAWMNAEWQVWQVNLEDEKVKFHPANSNPSPGSTGSVEMIVVPLQSLLPAARALLDRHTAEHGCSLEHAVADILAQAAIDRKRRLLDRFPQTGERSSVDSVDLIREERDAR